MNNGAKTSSAAGTKAGGMRPRAWGIRSVNSSALRRGRIFITELDEMASWKPTADKVMSFFGRRVRLGLTALANPANAVEALRGMAGRRRPVKLVAETAGQIVEGIGLRNTRERLTQLYGAAQHLILEPRAGGGMRAEVRLPFHTRSDLRAVSV